MAERWQQGAPVQQQAAPQGGGMVMTRPANPKLPLEVQGLQQGLEVERQRLILAQQQAAISAAAEARQRDALNKAPDGYRWGPPDAQGNPTMQIVPGGPADKAAQTGLTAAQRKEIQDKRSTLANLSSGITSLRSQYNDNFKGRSAAEYLPAIARPANGVFNDTSGSLSAYVAAALGLSGQQFNTPAEQQLFIGSILPKAGETDQQIENKLNRLDEMLRNADATSASQLGVEPTYQGGGPVQGAGGPAAQGGGPYTPDPTGARTFQTEVDRAYQNEAESAFKAGASREQLDAIAAKYGAPAFGPDLDQAIASRAANPAAPVGFTTPTTGREEAGITAGLANALPSAAGSYFTAAGNGLLAGQLGNIAQLTGSSEGGTDVAMGMAKDNPLAYLAGGLTGDTLGALAAGGILGKVAGKVANPALASVLGNPLTADTLYGAAVGAGSADDPLYGAVGGALVGAGGSALGSKIGGLIGGARTPQGIDTLNPGEQALMRAINETGAGPVEAALLRAQELGVPATLADVSPQVNALTGSAIRANPTVAGQARDTLAQRSAGQIDRFRGAVGRDLGAIENIPQRSEDLIGQARAAAGPLYDAAYAAPGMEDLQIADLLARPSMQRAMGKARTLAMEEGRDPYSLGFVLNDAGDVSVPQMGRYVEARGGRPSSPMSVISGQGNSAPADLVTFVRQKGGLLDGGGELNFMGFTNTGRRGTPFAGQDAKFGPLVNNDGGRSFDDMAEIAWESGYFGPPSEVPRPTEREFLEALENTYRGENRVFSVYDDDVINDYNRLEQGLSDWHEGEGIMRDRSDVAGPRPFAPPTSYGNMEEVAPTWQTVDYLKRGLDDVVQSNRSGNMGRLDTEGRAVNNTLQEMLSRVDTMNPDYAAARQAYAGPMQERAFLEAGQEAVRANPNQLGVDMQGLTPQRAEQMRMGFTSKLIDDAERLRNASNPFDTLNSPAMEQRLGTVFGEGDQIARLLAQRDLERQLAGSTNRLVGNSATAERSAADAAFTDEGALRPVLEGGFETAVSGAPVMTILRSLANSGLGQKLTAGSRQRAATRAEQIAPLALNTDPGDSIAQILALATRAADQEAAKEALAQSGRRAGSAVGTGIGTSILSLLAGQ